MFPSKFFPKVRRFRLRASQPPGAALPTWSAAAGQGGTRAAGLSSAQGHV